MLGMLTGFKGIALSAVLCVPLGFMLGYSYERDKFTDYKAVADARFDEQVRKTQQTEKDYAAIIEKNKISNAEQRKTFDASVADYDKRLRDAERTRSRSLPTFSSVPAGADAGASYGILAEWCTGLVKRADDLSQSTRRLLSNCAQLVKDAGETTLQLKANQKDITEITARQAQP